MRPLRRLVLTLFIVGLFAAPVVAWFAYPPSRVFIPGLAPITCGDGPVCVDDLDRLSEAQALYDEAITFVNKTVGQIDVPPRMYFCATAECSEHFGWVGTAGYNVGVFGSVIKPTGWVPHIVRHEMIHHLQNERMGMVSAFLNKPPWLLEGMAYSLSEDPRRPLSFSPDLEAQRARYEGWSAPISPEDLWNEIAKLDRNSP